MPNRRHLSAQLERIWRSDADRQELGCLVLDLDGFSQVNDLGGHAAGDAALKAVAAAVRKSMRPTDCCCRLTGDEFVVLALAAPRATLGTIAGRLRRAIEGCPVPGFEAMKLTVSIGVACGADWNSWDAALAEADRLLYEAKARAAIGWPVRPPPPSLRTTKPPPPRIELARRAIFASPRPARPFVGSSTCATLLHEPVVTAGAAEKSAPIASRSIAGSRLADDTKRSGWGGHWAALAKRFEPCETGKVGRTDSS